MHYHVTSRENLNSILELGLIAQSGDRSALLSDNGVYLFTCLDDVENALMNWLGDEFSCDDELIIIEIELPNTWELESEAGYEQVSRINIPAEHIVRFLDESLNEIDTLECKGCSY